MSSIKDKSHPTVAAFDKVRDALKRRIKGDGTAARWKQVGQFDRYRVTTSAHYALIQNDGSDSAPKVVSRLDQLERNMTAFYYWYALQRVALEVPKQRLVAVMEAKGDDAAAAFLRDNKIFDSVPITADSFYSPRHNLVVFCGHRLDQPYLALVKMTAGYWKAYNPTTILQPRPKLAKGSNELQLYSAQTVSILTKALDEDGEAMAVTHSGTRQLLTACGLLPRSVALPRWLRRALAASSRRPTARRGRCTALRTGSTCSPSKN